MASPDKKQTESTGSPVRRLELRALHFSVQARGLAGDLWEPLLLGLLRAGLAVQRFTSPEPGGSHTSAGKIPRITSGIREVGCLNPNPPINVSAVFNNFKSGRAKSSVGNLATWEQAPP